MDLNITEVSEYGGVPDRIYTWYVFWNANSWVSRRLT
jgi:hypothetical protein